MKDHRASLTFGEHLCRGSFKQCGSRAGNATALWLPPKQTRALPDQTRTTSHWKTCTVQHNWSETDWSALQKVSEIVECQKHPYTDYCRQKMSPELMWRSKFDMVLCIYAPRTWAPNPRGFLQKMSVELRCHTVIYEHHNKVTVNTLMLFLLVIFQTRVNTLFNHCKKYSPRLISSL